MYIIYIYFSKHCKPLYKHQLKKNTDLVAIENIVLKMKRLIKQNRCLKVLWKTMIHSKIKLTAGCPHHKPYINTPTH